MKNGQKNFKQKFFLLIFEEKLEKDEILREKKIL